MSYDENKSNQIYECRNNIAYYQNQIDSQERDKSSIQNKINRLISVRDSIGEYKISIQKDRFQAIAYRSNCERLDDWKGSTHDSFIRAYNDALLNDYKTYYGQIDAIHDALNSEIARLQNSIYEMDGVLGWLRARLNDCWVWLDNLMN